jgi:hypothetical protein
MDEKCFKDFVVIDLSIIKISCHFLRVSFTIYACQDNIILETDVSTLKLKAFSTAPPGGGLQRVTVKTRHSS